MHVKKMMSERIFIIGGTGNIGKSLVKNLISRNVRVTLYTRNPSKAISLFPAVTNIDIVQGDLLNLDPIKTAVRGHTRLFILVSAFTLSMQYIKGTVAQYAYEAGVQQIVDISSITASSPWRSHYFAVEHSSAEAAMLNVPRRGNLVVLRPGRFMSNMLTLDRVSKDGVFIDIQDSQYSFGWISPMDIAAVAAAVLTEDTNKHGDAVYELVGDCCTHDERAEILSRVLEKSVRYQKVRVTDKYNQLISLKIPHIAAYTLTCSAVTAPPEVVSTVGFPILIGRDPETLEQYTVRNKHLL